MGSALTTGCPKRQETEAVDAGKGAFTGGALLAPAPPLAKFRIAVRRVIRLLALRKAWSAYGRVLQAEPRRWLWEGLERKKGVLKRVKKLDSE